MYEYDSNFVFTNPVIPRKLLMIEENNYNKIEVFTENPNNIEELQSEIDYKIQAITASEARVGVHPRVEGRAIQGQKHEAFKNDINEDWEKFKESVNR